MKAAFACFLLLSVLVSGCVEAACACAPILNVSAASSLAGFMDDAKAHFTGTMPMVVATGSSATLRTQIEQGAPAVLFLSADTSNPQTLVDKGLASGAVVPFASNHLTVIVPGDNPAGIASPADLGKPGVCVLAAGSDVPITKYADQLVANLAARPEYGADFAARYAVNICSREDNVGAVVNKVSLGEGDAAIVYDSDALPDAKVTKIPVPAEANVTATYGAVTLKGSSVRVGAANDFLAWLRGADGQALLAAHGFGAAP